MNRHQRDYNARGSYPFITALFRMAIGAPLYYTVRRYKFWVFALLYTGLDPWYVDSLKRYIAMLRSESNESRIEGKIKIFRTFSKTESNIRGIDYYDTLLPPASLTIPPSVQRPEQSSTAASNISIRTGDLLVHVPQQPLSEVDG